MKEVGNFQAGRRDWEPIKPVIIDDLRFKNEAEYLKKEGFIIIRIWPQLPLISSELRKHRSETEMNEIEVDYEITSGQYDDLVLALSHK